MSLPPPLLDLPLPPTPPQSATTISDLILKVGPEPDRILRESKLFVPQYDGWRPEDGPGRLLESSRDPRMMCLVIPQLTVDDLKRIQQATKGKCFTSLYLVLDFYGLDQQRVNYTVTVAKDVLRLLLLRTGSLRTLKIWIRSSIRLRHGSQMRADVECCDIELPVVQKFFEVFILERENALLRHNLEHLWIEIKEDYDYGQSTDKRCVLPNMMMKPLTLVPDQFFVGQSKLIEFVQVASHRQLIFAPEFYPDGVHMFRYNIYDRNIPCQLIEEYSRPGLVRWAPYVQMISLVPHTDRLDGLEGYQLSEIWALRDRFYCLTHLRILLDSENFSFVQLALCLSSPERPWYMKVLQVDIINDNAMIINTQQVQEYLQQNLLPPLNDFEVLSINKYNFVSIEEINLHEETFAWLFPVLRVFTFWFRDNFHEGNQCGQYIPYCIYKIVREPLKHCQNLQTWAIFYEHRFGNHILDSSMPEESAGALGPNWERSRALRADLGAISKLTILVGRNPGMLILESKLYAPMHDQWRPEDGPSRLLQTNNPTMLHRQYPIMNVENRGALLDEIRSLSIVELNLALDLFGMTVRQVTITMQEVKDLVCKLGGSLSTLKIWIRSCLRFRHNAKNRKAVFKASDLELQVMKDLFGVFLVRTKESYLLSNLEYIWFDLQEVFDGIQPNQEFVMPALRAKELVPKQYLLDQKSLVEYAFHSVPRKILFQPEVYPQNVNLFYFKLLAENVPSNLVVQFMRPEVARWAECVTMISLIPPYDDLNDLPKLLGAFSSLTRLSVTLDSDNYTFVQLCNQLATVDRGWCLKVLQVRIMNRDAEIFNNAQLPEYLAQNMLTSLHDIEVLSIYKAHFNYQNEINLQENTFAWLFPSLRIFDLHIKDDLHEANQCQELMSNCIYQVLQQSLEFCQALQAWHIVYQHHTGRVALDSAMPVVNGSPNWVNE